MKRTVKKRARISKVKLPAWFHQFAKNLVARNYPPTLRGKLKTMFQAGAHAGHLFCELDKLREDYSATHPGAEAVHIFNEQRRKLAERIGKAAFFRKDHAVEFLSGILSELKRCESSRGEYADFVWHVFQKYRTAVLCCHSQREVANLVEWHMRRTPEWKDRVARWPKDRHATFYNAVREFCRRIGFTPTKRGRPAKK